VSGIARREAQSRDVLGPDELLGIGRAGGAAALGLEGWPAVDVDLDHPALHSVAADDFEAALVSSCGADVFA
jgi:hypothetical protein